MAAITRSWSVQYGSTVIQSASGPSGASLDGTLKYEQSYRKVRWRFGTVVYGANAAALETNCAALVTAIRTPRQDLTITMGTGGYSYSESSKTGYDIRGEIERVPLSPFDSPISREFSITFEVTLPATLASDAGLDSYSFTLTTTAVGQRILEIVGSYTTNGTLLAKATHDAAIATLVSAIFSSVSLDSANFELLSQDEGLERFDFEMSFKRTYRELLYKDSLAAFNSAALKDARITANVSIIYGRMAIPDQILPSEISVQYEALVDKSQSTDLPGLFQSVAKPLLQSIAQEYAASQGVSDPIILQIEPSFSPTGQVLRAVMIFVCFGPQRLIALETKLSQVTTTGGIKVGVYSDDPYARIRLLGQALARERVVTIATVQGDRPEALAAAQGVSVAPNSSPGSTAGIAGGGYRALSRAEYSRLGSSGGGWTLELETAEYDGPLYAGLPSLPVTTCILTREYEYDTEPAGGGAGGLVHGGGRKIVSSVYLD